MRTLIVDNYDSFTYNLAHYVAEVTGDEPTVIYNDDPVWRLKHLADFDNVIISPGPGTPERASDLGIGAEIMRHGAVPLLGVCLGHEALAHVHGGRVALAPQQRHGRLSPVHHMDTGLFAGLPSPLEVVRYHSLAVSALSEDFEATAWTSDGVLMGLRHRHRPLWGVQFHPESICTEHGHDLLANFFRLAERHNGAPGRPAGRPGTVPAGPPVAQPVRRLRVHREQLATRCDPELVFDELFRGTPYAFWLDSSRPDEQLGRFSMMGDAGGPLARVALADVQRCTVTVEHAGGTTEVHDSPFLDWLDQDLRRTETEVPDLPFDFALGWVGYLGYELKAECGAEAARPSPDPDAALIFADRVVVFDHAASTTYLLALAPDDDPSGARSWLDETAARLAELAAEESGRENRWGSGRDGEQEPLTLGAELPVALRHGHDQYLELIGACLDAIRAGETYEVCLTNMIEAGGSVDPWAAYRFLRRTSPAPFGALLRFDGLSVLSTSPERFLRVDREGVAESKPIKGTRPRGATPAEDRRLIEDLRSSEKDRAENLMIVDLVRNDLARCAEPGSVTVHKIFDVETYATVHQLVSTVRARLRPGRSAVDCVRAAFPGGSMTGAPKIRTMQIIDRLEAGPRGIYSGAIGYFSLSGATDLSIAIRTAVVTADRVRYGVGGAITALSDRSEEYEETAVKATPLLRLLGAEFPERVSPAGSAR
ncbi:aminodeoxychorismate synthase component I [Streptomyces sp. NPDC003038]|uniref:aminodeoxychorismate synthase component I n=1 Tax=unclassified Streptomyces TaxID=2593676 RepID=UPI0033B020AA